jgi:hypothetical protein
MVVPRQRPSHRIRRWASGLTRPIKGTTQPDPGNLLPPPQGPQPLSQLARFFAGFDPYEEESQPILPVPELRLRSAPWDTISDDASSIGSDSGPEQGPSSSQELSDDESIQDSIWVNLLSRRRDRPTHYIPHDISPVPTSSLLSQHHDTWIRDLITDGASLPPPLNAPHCFQRTPPSPLMDQVIEHLIQQDILRPQKIVTAYRCFLVPKGDQSARFIIDLSPLTPLQDS